MNYATNKTVWVLVSNTVPAPEDRRYVQMYEKALFFAKNPSIRAGDVKICFAYKYGKTAMGIRSR